MLDDCWVMRRLKDDEAALGDEAVGHPELFEGDFGGLFVAQSRFVETEIASGTIYPLTEDTVRPLPGARSGRPRKRPGHLAFG